MIKNKSGFIRIIEAFSMILLISGILLIVLSKGDILDSNESEKIYEKEQFILREIQLNNSLRGDILSFETLPVEWIDLPTNVKVKIIDKSPPNFNCEAKICNLDVECDLGRDIDGNVYAQKTIITASLEKYSPRELKIFCWEE
jgi:hypothetical protein|tara:strand:- start:94 stop:522 length:429 start_codon:yes stop_codon:yes gene_type:complete